jgi:RNA polymerase sigma factor (sigma-70 family)
VSESPSELSLLCAELDVLYDRQREAGIAGLSRELAVGLLRWAGAAAWAVRGGGSVNSYDREDAAQNAFISIQQNIDRFEPTEPFHCWAMKIIANKIGDLIRRKSVRGELTPPPAETDGDQRGDEEKWGAQGVVAEEIAPDLASLRSDDLGQLREISAAMEDQPSHRAFKLRHLCGLKLDEVAASLGCSTAQAYKLAERGLAEIREKMQETARWKTKKPSHG